jgi:hypothetical protein
MDDAVERLDQLSPAVDAVEEVRVASGEVLEAEPSCKSECLLGRQVCCCGDSPDEGGQVGVGIRRERCVAPVDTGGLDDVVPRVRRHHLGDDLLDDVEQNSLHRASSWVRSLSQERNARSAAMA